MDLLLISDLHLGAHLKPRVRADAVRRAHAVERDLPRFLAHYAQSGPWQLVVNGDFIDFWNIEVANMRGMSAEDLAVARLHAVVRAHPAVTAALAQFLRKGHGLVFVAGNHDAELMYPGVRTALIDVLEGGVSWSSSAPSVLHQTGVVRLRDLPGGRVRFVRWFLREHGSAWIEHGHKFDPSCITQASLSPMRQGRLLQTVAEVATRSFANLMPEIDYDAPDRFTFLDYVRWAGARGMRFCVHVLVLYLKMTGRLLALWLGGRADRTARRLHDEQLETLATNAGLQMSALQTLEAMAPPPDSATVMGLIRVTALDRMFTALFGFGLGLMLGRPLGPWVGAWFGLMLALVFVRRLQRSRSRRNVARDMLEVAASVGDVTGCPLVLMGHSGSMVPIWWCTVTRRVAYRMSSVGCGEMAGYRSLIG